MSLLANSEQVTVQMRSGDILHFRAVSCCELPHTSWAAVVVAWEDGSQLTAASYSSRGWAEDRYLVSASPADVQVDIFTAPEALRRLCPDDLVCEVIAELREDQSASWSPSEVVMTWLQVPLSWCGPPGLVSTSLAWRLWSRAIARATCRLVLRESAERRAAGLPVESEAELHTLASQLSRFNYQRYLGLTARVLPSDMGRTLAYGNWGRTTRWVEAEDVPRPSSTSSVRS